MEKDASTKRLSVLDGLRGLAILLVFFNHIDSGPILKSLPTFLTPLTETLVSSGRTGVSLFFLLSGFLMGYLYTRVSDKVAFLQKRYTRIFPLFLSFVITRTIFRNFSNISLLASIAAIFIPALCIHILWVYVIKKINNKTLSRMLFWAFIALQIVVGAIYALWVMRHPPIYLNQLLSPWIRESIISLVNATLTLPFGNYIPMLDGVYWSLIGEVLFYILYPIIFIPIAQSFQDQPRQMQALFLLSIIPFLLSLTQLSNKVAELFILDLPFFYFFVVGIIIAYLYKRKPQFFDAVGDYLNRPIFKYVPIVLFIFLFILLNYLFNNYQSNTPLIRIFSAFPFALLFIVALAERSTLSKLFQSKILVYFGTISYSMYLVQTSVVDTAKKLYHPTEPFSNLFFILIVLVIICIIAAGTHYLLEKPYFNRTKKTDIKKNTAFAKSHPDKPIFIITSLAFLYCLVVFIAYQSNFNFFSKEYIHTNTVISYPPVKKGQKIISMKDYPRIKLLLTAEDDNFGVLTMNLHYNTKSIFSKGGSQTLEFRIREAGSPTWYASSSYKAVEVGNSEDHPFGFPIIQDSKGKKYDVEIKLTDPLLAEYFDIDITRGVTRSVYQLNKYFVIKKPSQLISLIMNRIQTIMQDQEARRSFYYALPFFAIVYFSLLRKSTPAKLSKT